jgi:hypothetical protein
MEVFDVYYNGTFTITLTPSASNNSVLGCPTLTSQTIPNAFLRLGPQTNHNVTRSSYGDNNTYYFHFGRSLPDEKCPYTANKAFVNFESSNDNLDHGQIWTLNQKKSGDTFALDGSLTSTAASYNNFFNYVVNTTGSDAPYKSGCPPTFSIKTLLANSGTKMNATVSAAAASMAFEFTDPKTGYTIQGSFEGKHWEQGPKLLLTGEQISTEGEVPHVKPRAPKKGFWGTYGKWIVSSSVLLGLIPAIEVGEC